MDFEAAYSKRFRTGNFLRQRELNLLHYSQVFMYHDLLWAKPESRFRPITTWDRENGRESGHKVKNKSS